MELRVVIAGGGTGGHLYPGIAIAAALLQREKEARVVFMGTKRGLEARVIPEQGYELVLLPVRGLQRRLSLQNLAFPFLLAAAVWRCLRYYRRFRPHLVIGTGGYVSGPALLAALMARIPCAIQEQNSYPGLVNRKLGRRVNAVFATFEASRQYFAGQPNFFVLGTPVRPSLRRIERTAALEKFGLSPGRKTLLVFGGSQGAHRLNEVVGEFIENWTDWDALQVIWLTGREWFARWRHFNDEAQRRVRVIDFLAEMHFAYSAADLALCRSGATTIAELTLFGLPAVFIPFPFATADHQTVNAKTVAEAGGGRWIPEPELNAGRLAETVREILADEELRRRMAVAMRKLAHPQAAEEIVAHCLEIIGREA